VHRAFCVCVCVCVCTALRRGFRCLAVIILPARYTGLVFKTFWVSFTPIYPTVLYYEALQSNTTLLLWQMTNRCIYWCAHLLLCCNQCSLLHVSAICCGHIQRTVSVVYIVTQILIRLPETEHFINVNCCNVLRNIPSQNSTLKMAITGGRNM